MTQRHSDRDKGIALIILNLEARWGQVVNPRDKRHGARCAGDWLGLMSVLDGCGISRFHRDSIPGLPRT
jgi:hypothetical protein